MAVEHDLKAELLRAAEALDQGAPKAALAALTTIRLGEVDESVWPTVLALWKGTVRTAAADGLLSINDPEEVCETLDFLMTVNATDDCIWQCYRELPFLENQLGHEAAGAAVAALFWHAVLKASDGIFVAVFELFFRSLNGDRVDAAWQQFLGERTDYVPDYWRFHLYMKSLLDRGRANLTRETEECLVVTGRSDLEPLVSIYLMLIRQAGFDAVSKNVRDLTDARHRAALAQYALGASYATEHMAAAARVFSELTADTAPDVAAQAMMAARLANAERRWADVIEYTESLKNLPDYRFASQLLHGHALARVGRTGEARDQLMALGTSAEADPFQRARATLTNVTVDRLERRIVLPDPNRPHIFAELSGRPLAQSLWVGPRLRWIERLSIKSYLDNGWRYQLYAYDDPDNVPEGCEVLDASAIIPRKEVFREGGASGLHAGSVGAFSDLFRYRLLHQRGGMWTDTDVINFQRFEPDGRRFIATEIVDAGLTGLNGAMMAAPPGDKFVARAYERASEIIASKDMFFTRIGPYLLAELLVSEQADDFELLETSFLNPVPWMLTARLLQPFDVVAARPEIRNAINLHVYTETWRLIGLGLDHPPGPETFLGKLYAQSFGEVDLAAIEGHAA